MLTYCHNSVLLPIGAFGVDKIVVNGVTVDSVITEHDSRGYNTDIFVRLTNKIDEARSNIGYDSNNHGADAFTVEGYDVLTVNAVGNSLMIDVNPQLGNPDTPPQGTKVVLNSTLYDVYGQTITTLNSQVNGDLFLSGGGSQTLSQGTSITPITLTLDSTNDTHEFKNWLSLYDSNWNQLALSTIFDSLTIKVSNQVSTKSYTLTQDDLTSLNLHIFQDINFNLYEDLQGTITITGNLRTDAPLGSYSLRYTLFTNAGSSSVGDLGIYSSFVIQ